MNRGEKSGGSWEPRKFLGHLTHILHENLYCMLQLFKVTCIIIRDSSHIMSYRIWLKMTPPLSENVIQCHNPPPPI